MFDPSPDVLRDPYPLYARLRSASPLLHHPTLDLYAVFDYAGVERVMTDHASFGSAVAGGQPGTWLIFSDPPRHARLRAIISRVFTPRSVAELEPRIRSVSARLLDAQAGASVMDLVGDYAVPLPLVVIAELLGVPAGDYPRFRRWSEIMLGLIHTLEGGAAAERATEAFLEASREMGGYLADLGRAGRAGRSDDLLGRLRSAEVDGQPSSLIVRSRSARRISTARRTPASPAAPSPYAYARPTSTALAPRQSAFATSLPRRIPPSTSTSICPFAAAMTSGSARMVGCTSSS